MIEPDAQVSDMPIVVFKLYQQQQFLVLLFHTVWLTGLDIRAS
jgi:hypothetical protein